MGYICEKCGYEIKASITKHVNSCDGRGPRRKRSKKGLSSRGGWNKGKKLSETHPDNHNEIRKKLSDNHKGGGRASTKKKEEERRNKIRISINERYAKGWKSTCGRSKKYEHISPYAGKVLLDGTWELETAKYLDFSKIIWRRPAESFEYINLKGTISRYTPDFWIEDWSSYLEIKGYKTDLDDCKWSQFEDKLIVWFKKDLIKRKIIGK